MPITTDADILLFYAVVTGVAFGAMALENWIAKRKRKR